MSENQKESDLVVRKIFWITMIGAGLFAGTVFTTILPNW